MMTFFIAVTMYLSAAGFESASDMTSVPGLQNNIIAQVESFLVDMEKSITSRSSESLEIGPVEAQIFEKERLNLLLLLKQAQLDVSLLKSKSSVKTNVKVLIDLKDVNESIGTWGTHATGVVASAKSTDVLLAFAEGLTLEYQRGVRITIQFQREVLSLVQAADDRLERCQGK